MYECMYIYIYLYGEKSYRTGLAFIKYSSGMCNWQSRVIQPQMNHNYSTRLNLLYLLFIVWPEGEPIAVIPLKKATLLTPNKAGPGLCSITSCTSGSANRKCKSPWLASDPDFSPYAPKLNLRLSRSTALHLSAGRERELRFVRQGEALSTTSTVWLPPTAMGHAGLILKGLKSASSVLLQIIICWGSLQNLSPLPVLQTK